MLLQHKSLIKNKAIKIKSNTYDRYKQKYIFFDLNYLKVSQKVMAPTIQVKYKKNYKI